MHSALYRGWLRHRRFAPRPHAFRYGLYLMYLDLSELDTVIQRRWFWYTRGPALARFDRADHFGDPKVPLDQAVRDLVETRTGRRPAGPIRLLTHLRYFGYCFNPVSFYYCFDARDERVEAVVAEVTNTPWGERHCYVLQAPPHASGGFGARSTKAMHVSPFHPMALEYRWRFGVPGQRLRVGMALVPQRSDGADPVDDAPVFGASLALERVPIGARSLAGALLRFPLMTVQVVAAIHWQALRLWLKRVPVHDHPSKQRPPAAPAPTTEQRP
jgi:DUF1365 family protein